MSNEHLAVGSSHLWRMPEGLSEGVHVATVTAIDRHGGEWVNWVAFKVRGERPPRFWRSELWPTS